jgi:hypothetical protein
MEGITSVTRPFISERRRRQRGNAFLEAGLVFVPFFALFFGIVDFGMAIYMRNMFQHATREGVRYAVTFQTSGGMGHDASIKSIVKTHCMGFLSGPTGDSYIRIRYYNPTTLVETGANSPGNIVEVSVEGYQWGVVAPLLRSANPIQLAARSSDRMESVGGGGTPPAR